MSRFYAAADIGSNTVHLLVADVSSSGLRRVENESVWLNLGEIVSREGLIPKKHADTLVEVLARFRALATKHSVEDFYVFATEAMRKASNHTEILARIATEAGVVVEIISPTREASLSVAGLQLDVQLAGKCLMVEAGGGSVQVASIIEGNMVAERSLALGTGALIAKSGLQQPATESQVLRAVDIIQSELEQVRNLAHVERVVACGGVARGVVRALHPDGDPHISIQDLEYLAWDTRRLSIETIVKRYGVKQRRAVTLLPGSLVYHAIMASFAVPMMTVSEFGVREGAVLGMAKGAGVWR